MGLTSDISWRLVYESPTASVGDVRCRAHDPGRGGEEASIRHTIVFPRAGVFVRHVRGETVVGDANQVLFFQAGEPYRVSHPVGCGDRCTSIALSGGVLGELLTEHDPGAMELRAGPFRHTHGPTDPRADLRHRRLMRALADARGPDLATDEEIVALLDAAVAGAYRVSPGAPSRPDTLRAHRDLTEGAKVVLAGRFRERVVLDDVARAVHSSPFHLARVFRALAGMPMHRYLTRLRLRAALEHLAGSGPKPDLSRLALSLGFYDQSHLANAFRAELGLSPSRWRREAAPGRARRMSKILQD